MTINDADDDPHAPVNELIREAKVLEFRQMAVETWAAFVAAEIEPPLNLQWAVEWILGLRSTYGR